MYLCYADESGFSGKKYDPSQPVQTMVAVCPNVYNFHRSDSEFRHIYNIINKRIPISEIKGQQIYRGKGSWKNIASQLRDQVIEYYIDWIKSRNHKLILTAIDNKEYFDAKKDKPTNRYISAIPYPYLLAGLHTALVVQKRHKNIKKNKGKTLLIFDEQNQFESQLADLIFSPPEFIDEFVPLEGKKEVERLNQIIDTAFFVKSHHSSMAQVVDIVAYLFRLHIQLKSYNLNEAYHGEAAKISNWLNQIQNKIVSTNYVYPRSRSPFISFLQRVKAKGL